MRKLGMFMLAAVAVIITIVAVAMFFKGANAQGEIIRRIDLDPSQCTGPSPGDCFYEERCTDPCATSEEDCQSWERI